MMTRSIKLILLLASALFASVVCALPAPMSHEELNQKSDLIGTFHVLGVTRTNDITIEQLNQTVPSYQAWMQVISITKGDLKPNDTFLVKWRGLPKNILGPWQVPYHPGETVETYLIKSPDGLFYYTTTWWNAANHSDPEHQELPSKIGSVAMEK